MKNKIYLLNLGCARNLVDLEIVAGLLKDNNFDITYTIKDADVAILNTCVFIKEAKEESIGYLFDLVRLKKEGKLKKIIVIGCFTQRYPEIFKKEIPEVDGIIGFNRYPEIHKAVKLVLSGKKVYWISSNPDFIYNHKMPRIRLTPNHFAYVKISEGCNHACSFCIIPKIKGRLRSRPIDSILSEVKKLAGSGAKEIILIGQDTTAYGLDIYKKLSLANLLKEVVSIKNFKWLRLLYAYPAYFSKDIISCFEKFDKICKYIDIPLQHISDKMLKEMKRGIGKKNLIKLIKTIRERLPETAIRTSFIVGFPKENKKDFKELVEFIKEIKFERLGLFKYSREEGTPAYDYKGQIPEKEKERRYDEIMLLQKDISGKINLKFLNKEMKIIVDEKVKGKPSLYLGRTQYDAPEVDGQVYLTSKRKNLKAGSIVNSKIISTYEYDLIAREI